jgi:hypothetical protein
LQPRITQIVALVLSGILVLAASTFTPTINQGRKDLDMYGVEEVTESAPPEYAFAIQAFGAFRGVITNFAFIRAEEYKRDGRFYDAMQLASWICKLQPRFPSVWEFQSWNMAWNISVTTYTPEERWNWVYNGAKLIRDEGLKYNPRAVNLYRQLAWIFVNKMSETTDEYHLAYKRNWAWRMHLVLGPPPDPLGEYRPGEKFEKLERGIGDDELAAVARGEKEYRAERDRKQDPNHPEVWEDPTVELDKALDQERPLDYEIAKKAAFDRLKAIADAPGKLAGLYAAVPETRDMVSQLRQLGANISDDVLSEDEYYRAREEDSLAFTFFKRFRQLEDPASLLTQIERNAGEDSAAAAQAALLERFDQIVGVREKRPAGQALLRFLQRKVLLEVYKLDPNKMAELTEIFGPMDWRVVDAHSLYWVNEGLIAGQETISKFGNDKINTARLIFFSLNNLRRRNRLVFEPYYDDLNRSYINFNPDLNFIESMHRAYLAYGKLLDPDPQAGGVGGTFRTGHQNFLTDAIRLLYFAGREREARKYFNYVRESYGRNAMGEPNPAVTMPLAEYVVYDFLANITGDAEMRDAIAALLARAFNELARGNRAEYNAQWRTARELHTKYNKDKLTETTDKMRLPPFPEYEADVVRVLLRQPAFSPLVTQNKARLWLVLPLRLKHAVYDDLRELFARECQTMKYDVDRAFPEPPGMDQYRAEKGHRGPEEKKDDVETPAQQPG